MTISFPGHLRPQNAQLHQEAALLWTDLRDERSNGTPLNVLVKPYANLMAAYSTADRRGNDFTSRASKSAMGCIIPMLFPIFDSCQGTLTIISKIERDIRTPSGREVGDGDRFIWQALLGGCMSATKPAEFTGPPGAREARRLAANSASCSASLTCP